MSGAACRLITFMESQSHLKDIDLKAIVLCNIQSVFLCFLLRENAERFKSWPAWNSLGLWILVKEQSTDRKPEDNSCVHKHMQ